MNLSNAKHRETYIESIKALEDELKSATTNEDVSDLQLHDLQQKLDTLADTYQDDESIGSARYKLYELQAFIHYFEQRPEQALDFINRAIELRGSSYQKAEKLKHTLEQTVSQSAGSTSQNKAPAKLVGLKGWLAVFIVGEFLGIIMTLFNLFNGGVSLAQADVDAYNDYQGGLGDTLQTLVTIESMSLVVIIALMVTTVVLLFRKSKHAKAVAIASIATLAIYSVIDYVAASSIFSSVGLDTYDEINASLNQTASTAGRNLLYAFIWIPYFIVSKRVKATLTR